MSVGAVGKVTMGAQYAVAANAGEYTKNLADSFMDQLREKVEIAEGRGLAVIEQAKDTILSATKEALKTTFDAFDGMAQGIVSGTMAVGSSVYGMVQSKTTDAMSQKIDNINTLKNSLGTKPASQAVVDGDSAPPVVTPSPDGPFKKAFDKALSPEDRAKLFEDQAGKPDYFKDAAVDFAGIDETELAQVRADLDGLAKGLQTKMSMTSDETQSIVRSAQAIGSALGQAIGGGIQAASAEAVLEKGMYDAMQAYAENAKNFYDTMNSSIDQMMNKFVQAWGDVFQTVRSVVQTSGQV